jgi:hypothetical protein
MVLLAIWVGLNIATLGMLYLGQALYEMFTVLETTLEVRVPERVEIERVVLP